VDCIVINGGRTLSGEVTVSGSKNSALTIMAATLLSSGCHRISGVPGLRDIKTMKILLGHLGAEFSGSDELIINTENIKSFEAPYELVKTMRASFLVMGPLVAHFGRAKVSLPGGCAIGLRPVDIHIKAFEAMGVAVNIDQGYVNASCRQLRGAHILFDKPTVGGTENIMMAACLAKGTTTIENAAREPEVVELARALKKMGARIHGEGTDTIVIDGVDELKPLTHTVMPDRIEAGTFMVAGGITGGNICIKNCPVQTMGSTVEKLREAGLMIEEGKNNVCVERNDSLKPVEVTTNPYPGFPTDMQAQIMTLLTLSEGASIIRETIFENRFIHVAELDRMGANIKVERDSAIVVGVKQLRGASVMATDLRASASLILAGLAAKGTTVVSRIYHLDRGYDSLEKKLQSLGADIYREKDKN
jgi:UDP-N-acetylglucosamine 1-carboxyvinyltransferase